MPVPALTHALGSFSILLQRYSLRWSDWISNWAWGLGIGLTATFVLVLFRLVRFRHSPRWRPVAWFAGFSIVALFLGNAFAPGVIQSSHSVNPLGIAGPVGDVLELLQHLFGGLLISALLSIVSLVVRFRGADPTEREQLRWLVYAAGCS